MDEHTVETAPAAIPEAQPVVPAAAENGGDVGAAAEQLAPAEQQEQAHVQPSQVSDDEVKQRLLALLGKSDLTKTTEKMVRKQLEEELGMELSSKKALIRQEVLAYLEEHLPAAEEEEEEEEEEAEEEQEEEEEEEQPKKRAGGGGGSSLSQAMQDFLGVETMARPQVVKAIWAYIKQNNLQNPKDKRKIMLDEKLSTIFTPPITMFNMNKQLSNHVFSSSSVAGEGGASKPRPAKRKKAAHDGDSSPKRNSGFSKPIPLSEGLAAATGKQAMSRGEFAKWLYAYVDEHNLKDPSDKRYADCDETLEALTGEKRIMLFGGQKYFKEHFIK